MAKTESTAVNQLIAGLANGKPEASDPTDDLFGPPKARVTATIPPMRGAGEVAPLPRNRAPSGTSKHVLPAVPPPVRISTAPARAQSIPPIGRSSEPGRPPSMPKLPLPRSSRGSLPPPTRTTQPSMSPVAAPFEARPVVVPAHTPAPVLEKPRTRTGSKPAVEARMRTGIKQVVKRQTDANPFVVKPITQRAATVDVPGDPIEADNWFEASRAVDRVDIDITWNNQRIAMRERSPLKLAKKLALPITAALAVGVAFGGFLAFRNEGAKKHAPAAKQVATAELAVKADEPAPIASHESNNAATATAGASQPQPPAPKGQEEIAAAAPAAASAAAAVPAAAPAAAAPAAVAAPPTTLDAADVHEVKTTRGVVKLVDVRIDSKPAGATVMLVDNGKTSFLGTAPVVASVDPSRSYDVVFTLEGRGTQMLHLDPTKTHRLEVALHHGASAAKAAPAAVAAVAPAPAVAAAPAPAPAPKAKKASAPTGQIADPVFDAPPAAAPAASGKGTLMISSKPPCEILIDGNDSGRKTPQKAMSLPAGDHQITFVNTDENIKKTVPITITADHTTKLIQNLMK